jgi:hypothetical protein
MNIHWSGHGISNGGRAFPSEVGQAENSRTNRQPCGKAQVVHQQADVTEIKT